MDEYPDDVESDFNSEIYYDLGTEETANSYIVSSANYKYCFDVTVKGNGSMGVADGKSYKGIPSSFGVPVRCQKD